MPGLGQGLQVPGDQGLAAYRQQGFGAMVGQGAHAFAASRSQDHGAHQNE